MKNKQRSSGAKIARAQGAFNILGGAWPIVGLGSFEFVYGRKTDVFLQKTVGGLLFSIGCVQVAAAGSPEGVRQARRLGIATAVTLLAVDAVYIPKGDMRRSYLQDALCESAWLAAWLRQKA